MYSTLNVSKETINSCHKLASLANIGSYLNSRGSTPGEKCLKT